jgi:hypothetical protein
MHIELILQYIGKGQKAGEGFISVTASERLLGPSQLPVKLVSGGGGSPSQGEKRPEREAYHPPPSSAEFKNA